jgi:hypothetical protein
MERFILWSKWEESLNNQRSSKQDSSVTSFLILFMLKRCLVGASRNLNEAFHSLMYQRAPKSRHSGKLRFELALDISVCIWNAGYPGGICGLMEGQRLPFDQSLADDFESNDRMITRATVRKTHKFLKKRKASKISKAAFAAKLRKEKPNYGPGLYS